LNSFWLADLCNIIHETNHLTIQMRDERYLWKHVIIAEASVTFEEAKSMLTDGTNVRLGHHLLDNPKILHRAWKAALDTSAKILEKRKSVLNHLGRARKCVKTLMGFGMVASSIHPISSLAFSSVNVTYKFLEVQDIGLMFTLFLGNLQSMMTKSDGRC